MSDSRTRRAVRCAVRRNSAIAAIHHNSATVQARLKSAEQKIHVTTNVVRLGQSDRSVRWVRFFKNAKDFFFDLVFFRVRQLETGAREDLDTVVGKGVVRRRNHDSRPRQCA